MNRVFWKCVAAVAAERRDAAMLLRVTASVASIGRTALSDGHSSQIDEYRYWRRFFDTVNVQQEFDVHPDFDDIPVIKYTMESTLDSCSVDGCIEKATTRHPRRR